MKVCNLFIRCSFHVFVDRRLVENAFAHARRQGGRVVRHIEEEKRRNLHSEIEIDVQSVSASNETVRLEYDERGNTCKIIS